MTQQWRTVRIFISSTFRDMNAEREALVHVVFPELREWCAQRRLHLVSVDLRWGVSQEDVARGKLLDVCLAQIDRCRPFFLGLIGDRYGTVLQEYQVPEGEPYQWLRKERPGRSITALEIHHALMREGAEVRPLIFFRDSHFIEEVPEPYREIYRETDEDAQGRLKELKEQLKARLPAEAIFSYTCHWAGLDEKNRPVIGGLGGFVSDVTRALKEAIAQEFPLDEPEPDALTVERAYHQRFIADHGPRVAGRESEFLQLAAYADGDNEVPAVVTGPPGSGKSALLAYFASQYAADRTETFVLYHFVGTSPGSTDLRRTLRRLCAELRQRFGFDDEIPTDLDQLRQIWLEMLARGGSHVRVVVVLDAINQLRHNGQWRWLPETLPEGVRLIVSTTSGAVTEALSRRRPQPQVIELQQLTEATRRQVVQGWLAPFGKRLEETAENNQIGLLLAKPGSQLPLYLIVACEELRLYGDYETVTRQIEALPAGVEALFQQVLERMERTHDPAAVRDALALIACSRNGLLEGELLDLLQQGETPVPALHWARIYRALSFYLRPPGEEGTDTLDFFHGALREAVKQKYVSPEAEAHYHWRMANYFRSRIGMGAGETVIAADPRPYSELPYHLLRSGSHADAVAVLTDLEFVEAKCRVGLAADILSDYEDVLSAELRVPESARAALSEFQGFLLRQVQVVDRFPGLTVQQALNHPAGGAPVVAAGRALERKPRPVLRLLDPGKGRDRSLQVFPGNKEPIAAMAFAPDPHILAAASGSLIWLWNAKTAKPQVVLEGHAGAVRTLAFAPAGDLLASGGEDRRVHLWDVEAGTPILALTHNHRVVTCSFSPDGSRLLTGTDDGHLHLWDVELGELLWSVPRHLGSVHCAAWSPDGERIASCEFKVKVTDARTGRQEGEMFTLMRMDLIEQCRFTPEGLLRTVGGNVGISTWDLDEQVRLYTISTGSTYTCLAPNGQIALGVRPDGSLVTWNPENGRRLARLGAPASPPVIACFSADGERVATASRDGTIILWDAAPEEGGDESLLATFVDTTVYRGMRWLVHRFYAQAEQRRVQSLAASDTWWGLTSAVISPDGNRIAAGYRDKTAHVWDTVTGRRVMSLRDHKGAVTALAWSPDGARLATGSKDRCITIWDPERGEPLRRCRGHTGSVTACAWSADGTLVAGGAADGTVRIWSAATGWEVHQCTVEAGRPIDALDWSPAGHQIAALANGVLAVLTMDEDGLRLAWRRRGTVTACAWSGQGKRVLWGNRMGSIRVADASGKNPKTVGRCPEQVTECAWVSGGRLVAALAGDHTMRIFNPKNGEPVALWAGDGALRFLGARRQGRFIRVSDGKGSILVMRLEAPE